uniref:Uncharacterized protein n=1 Tax=Anopheles epiroticus TaxID=199890 RepID=A0A182PRQ6_9DIPT
MTKLLEEVRQTDRSAQDGTDPDAAGCWTKLLEDTTRKPQIIVGPGTVHPEVGADIVKELLVTVDPETGKAQQTIDGAASNGERVAGGRRRESIFGTVHRQLRMSLKAVSETPGPLTRQTGAPMTTFPKNVHFCHCITFDPEGLVGSLTPGVRLALCRIRRLEWSEF